MRRQTRRLEPWSWMMSGKASSWQIFQCLDMEVFLTTIAEERGMPLML